MGTVLKSDYQVQESKMEKANEIPSVITISKKEANPKKKSFWHIDKSSLPFKMHFFFFIGGMGAALPFLSAIGITRLGLTASNLAAAFTTQQILFILFKPAIGYMADYFNKLKATIIGLTVIQTIFFLFMIIIPETDVQGMTESYESNRTLDDPYSCLLCDTNLDFSAITASSVEEETILQSCLQHLENFEEESIELQCFRQNNFHPLNFNFHLLYARCNDSFYRYFSLQSEGSSKKIMYIRQSNDGNQTSSLVCISPERLLVDEIYGDYDSLRQYCRRISETVFLKLTKHFRKLQPKVAKCESFAPYDEASRVAALSAANFKTYQFWLFSFFLIVSCTCASSIFTISDTACYESAQSVDYGRQRAWGAVSWGLIAPIAGFLNDYTESYMASWCMMVVLFLVQFWNLRKMDFVKPDFSGSMLKDLKKVFSSVEFLAFEVGVLMNGIFTGVIWFYLTWYLIFIGGNKLVVGLAHTVQCFLGEVPIMFISGWMIKKFGHFNLVSLALLCHGIRFFAYSYINNPWFVLPLESLHGFTFGSFYSAMTSYGKLSSKPGAEATTQSVLCATYEALGAGLGCLIAGICFDSFGMANTWYYASYLCAISTLINVVLSVLVKCRQGVLNVTKPAVNERY